MKALFFAASLAVPAAAQDSAPVRTLADAYARALAASESIVVSEQSLRQARELYRRALGVSLPELSARHTSDWVDGPDSRRAESNGMLRASYTAFSGYRELYNAKAAKAAAGEAEALLARARQLLLADVAAAFFGQLQSRENVAATKRLLDLADKRLRELGERVRVGRNREADRIGQEVQVAGLRSQLEENARLEAARADLLRYLTRSPAVEPQAGEGSMLGPEKPLENYLARLDSRPDVAAARKAAESARASARGAWAERLPSLTAAGNWYGYRPAARRDTRWDAGLTVSVPLWSWGSRRATVAAADAAADAEEAAYAGARRQAELDIRDAFRDHASARRQLAIQRRAVDLAERDYELQTRDEKRGLVTSLDVLESLNRLNAARLNLTGAVLNARLTAIQLDLAAGGVPEEMDL